MAITDTCFGAIALDRETLEGGVVVRLSGDVAKRNEEVEQKDLRHLLQRLGRRDTLCLRDALRRRVVGTKKGGIGLLHVI